MIEAEARMVAEAALGRWAGADWDELIDAHGKALGGFKDLVERVNDNLEDIVTQEVLEMAEAEEDET